MDYQQEHKYHLTFVSVILARKKFNKATLVVSVYLMKTK